MISAVAALALDLDETWIPKAVILIHFDVESRTNEYRLIPASFALAPCEMLPTLPLELNIGR